MVDLSNCEKEPIHLPGRIQPHGILIVLQEPALTILQISANINTVPGLTAENLLQQPLSTLLGENQTSSLQASLNTRDIQVINPIKLAIQTKDTEQVFDGSVHRIDNALLLELENIYQPQSSSYWGLYHTLKLIIARLQRATHLPELCQLAAEEIRTLSGYDRVMVYQFDEHWNGNVIAENKRDDQNPFLGLRFPASDIPKQARAMYEQNWLRMIVDVDYQPVEIVPTNNPLTQQPLNLSCAALRSVSPIHIEYLKNMGVHASLCLSLMKEQVLWGMIVCHHSTARHLNYEMRTACELIGQIISSQLAAKESNQDHAYEMRVKTLLTRLIRNLQKEEEVFADLQTYQQDLLDIVSAQGAVLFLDQQHTEIGVVPPAEMVKQLVAWLNARPDEGLYHTTSLPGTYKGAEVHKNVASGLLALPISRTQGTYVLWFRPEVIQTVNWGGDPNAPVEVSAQDTGLHPRRSFEQWKETIRLTSTAWKECELMAAFELRSVLIDITLRDMILKQTLGSWLKS